MRRLATLTTAAILAVCGVSANAELLSANNSTFGAGSITLDSSTGLSWLDLTLSGTRSYNDMIGVDGSNEFAAGGAYAGFRYATISEVSQLWIDAGVPESAFFYGIDPVTLHNIGTFQTSDPGIFANARALQELLGYELTVANPPFVNAGGWRTAGLALGDNGELGLPDLETCTVGTGFCGGSSIPITRADIANLGASAASSGQHHWLVETSVSPIPEPNTYAMVLVGLGLIGWRMRSKRGEVASA